MLLQLLAFKPLLKDSAVPIICCSSRDRPCPAVDAILAVAAVLAVATVAGAVAVAGVPSGVQAFAAFLAVPCYILDVGGFVAAAFLLSMASMLMLML